ncbi:hypothetical protein Hanom_Chr05g00397461 [Helianthus anomalus]
MEFFNILQQQEKVNFNDTKLAKSFPLEHEDVLDPATNKSFTTMMWPPTKQSKTVPLLKELPDNSLKDLQFWMVAGVKDLMHFGENDIKLLGRTQIRSDHQYEVCAKTFIDSIAKITLFKLGSGQRSRVETQLFGPYVGRRLPDLQKKQKKKRK